jgi:hypothetical protein
MKEADPIQLIDQLKQVKDRITAADINYRIWRIYTEPTDRAKYLKVLQKYNAFFHASLQAHFAVAIITLYSLYETRADGISIPILVRYVSEPKLRAELDTLVDEANLIWRRKITTLRNEHYAHLSDVDVMEIFSRAKLTPNEMARLIEISKQLLNKMSYALDRSTYSFNLDPACDTYDLLDTLLKEDAEE